MFYPSHCDNLVRPFMNKDYLSIEQLDNDISYVCNSLINISLYTIPSTKPRHRNHTWVFDLFLSHLCWRSRVAYREWKAAGCQRSGQVYENRKKCERKVVSHLNKCRACIECLHHLRSHHFKSEGSSYWWHPCKWSGYCTQEIGGPFLKAQQVSVLSGLFAQYPVLVPNGSHNLPRERFCFISTVCSGRDWISSSSFKERQLWWTWSAYSTTPLTQWSSVQKLDLQNLQRHHHSRGKTPFFKEGIVLPVKEIIIFYKTATEASPSLRFSQNPLSLLS